MKSLELNIYPRDEDGDYIHPYNDYRIPEIDIDYWTECKRLTSAELAAEWHANEVKAWRMLGYRPEFFNADFAEKLERQGDTLRRFATLPHYDEADA